MFGLSESSTFDVMIERLLANDRRALRAHMIRLCGEVFELPNGKVISPKRVVYLTAPVVWATNEDGKPVPQQ